MPLTKIQSLGITDGTIVNADINASAAIAGTKLTGVGITLGTSVASTSGTSIDFTGLPSTAKRITVMFSGVSTSGTSSFLIQIGSTTFTTSGYAGMCISAGGSNQVQNASFSAGFTVTANTAATYTYQGVITLSLLGSNTWCESGNLGTVNLSFLQSSGGVLALGGVLDRVRITTVNGTDTFDAGTINISYE
jgi:hypothetical protein